LEVAESITIRKQRATEILSILKDQFPILTIPLDHRNGFELLIATILSAQTTDLKVNTVTPELFARYPDAETLAAAQREDVAGILKPLGLYNTKARNIIAAAALVNTRFHGQVPDTLGGLMELPGVARKVATVVLAQWFKRNEGFTVDTHVIRLAQKYGLTEYSDPKRIEQDLMQLFPQDEWADTSLRLIFHGRNCCKARGGNPQELCLLGKYWAE
jgi:endonuclease III